MKNGFNRDRDLPRRPPAWMLILETLIASVSVPVLGRLLLPSDPFFIDATFPWSALAPMLLGLRHGSASGIASAAVIVLEITIAWKWGWLPVAEFPGQFSLALLVVGLLAGEFSDMWTRRQQRLATMLEYHRTRLDEFTRTYQVLKASHDIIQQRLAADPQSLRDALIALKRQLGQNPATDDPFRGVSDAILNMFADFGQIQVATLFAVNEREVIGKVAARLGDGTTVKADDPLIRAALGSRKLASVGVDFRGREGETELLAAIPLVDVNDRVWGLLAVREMLFTAFRSETMKLLAVLAGHLGDMLAFGNEGPAREEFVREVRRCLTDGRRFGLRSSLIRISAPADEKVGALLDQIAGQRRGLDRAVVVESGAATRMLYLLLPLTDEAGLSGFKDRLEGIVRTQLGGSVKDVGLQVEGGVLTERATTDLLKPFGAAFES